MVIRGAGTSAVAAVLGVAGVLSLAWTPFVNDRAEVPDCAKLVAALPDGAWAASRPDPDQHSPASWAACELALTPAGRPQSGSATVLITGETTPGRAIVEVGNAPCDGITFGFQRQPEYTALRGCTEQFGQTIRSTVVASDGPRWAYVVVSTDSTAPGADDLAHELADRALTTAA